MADQKVIVVTGASSGFGNQAARALARAGHTVYAGMRGTADRNAKAVAELAELSAAEGSTSPARASGAPHDNAASS